MKAITLTQPWATLVAIGAKKIETRSWNTNYRGPLAIHAAKNFPKYARHLCFQEPFKSYVDVRNLPLGVIVAICELSATAKIIEDVSVSIKQLFGASEFSFGDYSIGRYMWYLEDIRPLENPIPARGALSLWEWAIPMLAE